MGFKTIRKSVTALANVNIALLKYWGKKDEALKLPFQTSISLTLEGLYTVSTLTIDPDFKEDELYLNGEKASDKEQEKIRAFFDLFRKMYKCKGYIRVNSENHVPTGAGLASSASAYASIATGLNDLFNLKLGKKEISMLARLGSGSASRSIFGGFTIWHHGDTHESSFAENIQSDWDDLVFVVVVLSKDKKKISSREAMAKSVKLPAYQTFLDESKKMVPLFMEAIQSKELHKLGPLVEKSSDLLHATIRSTGIDYYLPETYELLKFIKDLKHEAPLYYTIDAGPNVKLLTSRRYLEHIINRLSRYEVIISAIGGEAYVQS